MPKQLKEGIRERFQKEAARVGVPDLLDKIATEDDAATEDEVVAHLEKVGHPAVALPPLL
jgi:acetyl-CoA synthase